MMEEARTGERRRPFSQVLRVAGHWWVPHSSGVRLPPLQHRARPGASCVLSQHGPTRTLFIRLAANRVYQSLVFTSALPGRCPPRASLR